MHTVSVLVTLELLNDQSAWSFSLAAAAGGSILYNNRSWSTRVLFGTLHSIAGGFNDIPG
jgi:hypothetical protein